MHCMFAVCLLVPVIFLRVTLDAHHGMEHIDALL